ncbi:MAG: hypothetical protein AMXMBFR61_15350 [Fimbriimonadales bacterium]
MKGIIGRTAVRAAALLVAAGFLPIAVPADTLELKDGTILQGCYVRDEGIRYTVWENLEKVGSPPRVIPRSAVKSVKIERPDEWDVKPNLPDLTVTYIEMNPKLAGLHGKVNYDVYGRPSLGNSPLIPDLGERIFLEPEEAAKKLKLEYEAGEEITLTGHVRNLGFATAKPFEVVWLIDGQEMKRERCRRELKEMEEFTTQLKWHWRNGFHEATLRIVTDQKEIATINNEATDPLWAFSYFYIVSNGRVKAWHEKRTAYGTFSFEDFYRWHLDIMNLLFAHSVWPASPKGIIARVRLDKIYYTDDVDQAVKERTSPDGIAYDQGGWIWIDDQDRNKKWEPASKEWRNQTEWSLPHELGHQLGLVDYYALDYAGHEDHVAPDNGEKVTHFQNHPQTMMHWHGPHLYNEVDAGYLNMTWDKPRGHFGDYYFAIPDENYLRITDVNGLGVPDAKVEIYQRGCTVDPNGTPGEDHGVKYFPVIEDGDFGKPVSKDPVIVGTTDREGYLRLPNRPVMEVRTLNGFHRKPNPWGNINVVGGRGLMLVKVTKYERPVYFWLEATEFIRSWFRGQKDRYVTVLKTPYRSLTSPLPPTNVKAEKVDEHHVKVTWQPSPDVREQHYFDRAIGYRVYRRIGYDGLNDRPWFPVATVGPNTFEALVDLREYPEDVYWFSKTNRFAVTAVGDLSMESELVEVLLPQQ